MNIQNISLGIFALVACATYIPMQTHAYFTTEQTATKLTATTALYTIEYTFGLVNEDIYMPVVTQRDLEWKSSEHIVGYSIDTDEDETVTTGTAAGVVLSDAPIVNGMYKIDKGEAQKMTLLVLFKTEQTALEDSYKLQVGQLPYFVDTGEDDFTIRQLNPSELQHYVTETITVGLQ